MTGKFALLCVIFMVFHVSFAEDFYGKCAGKLDCIEKNLVEYVDTMDGQMSEARGLPFFGQFVKVTKSEEIIETRGFGEDLVERCVRFLANHEVRLRIPGETSRALLNEARSSKIKKILLPLLLLLKLKAAIVIPAILSAIALIAFKGLGASLIALAISGATGLKSLLEHHHGKSTFSYEVVPQLPPPHWSRSGVDPIHSGYHTIP